MPRTIIGETRENKLESTEADGLRLDRFTSEVRGFLHRAEPSTTIFSRVSKNKHQAVSQGVRRLGPDQPFSGRPAV